MVKNQLKKDSLEHTLRESIERYFLSEFKRLIGEAKRQMISGEGSKKPLEVALKLTTFGSEVAKWGRKLGRLIKKGEAQRAKSGFYAPIVQKRFVEYYTKLVLALITFQFKGIKFVTFNIEEMGDTGKQFNRTDEETDESGTEDESKEFSDTKYSDSISKISNVSDQPVKKDQPRSSIILSSTELGHKEFYDLLRDIRSIASRRDIGFLEIREIHDFTLENPKIEIYGVEDNINAIEKYVRQNVDKLNEKITITKK